MSRFNGRIHGKKVCLRRNFLNYFTHFSKATRVLFNIAYKFTNLFNTNLSGFCSSWKIVHCLRILIQNLIDRINILNHFFNSSRWVIYTVYHFVCNISNICNSSVTFTEFSKTWFFNLVNSIHQLSLLCFLKFQKHLMVKVWTVFRFVKSVMKCISKLFTILISAGTTVKQIFFFIFSKTVVKIPEIFLWRNFNHS